MKTIALATAIFLTALATAHAEFTNSHVIHFKKNETCWSYAGRDSSFVGRFLSWQDVTLKAFFETDDGLKDAKVKVYRLDDGREVYFTDAGSFPTPEGGSATYKFDVQVDQPVKNIHLHICAITEKME